MTINKKKLIYFIMVGFAIGCMFCCGIFAVVTKTVGFNLALKINPNIYFALDMQIDYNGNGSYNETLTLNNVTVNENDVHRIFNNTTIGTGSVGWSVVNQNTIVLNKVMAGSILENISADSVIKITVTNYTTEMDDGEYFHVTLNYNSSDIQNAQCLTTGGGAVNIGRSTELDYKTGSFEIKPTGIIATSTILIPFKAEIGGLKHKITIATDELCEVVTAPAAVDSGNKFIAMFDSPTMLKPYYYYTVNAYAVEETQTVEKTYTYTNRDGKLELDPSIILGDVTIDVKILTEWQGETLGVDYKTNYSGGLGTEGVPYLISSALDMAQLASNTNSGITYEGTYFKMTNDIYLNDETFEFQDDTGLVKVTDGVNTCYLGTGITGITADASDNEQFDMTASERGIFYYLENETYNKQESITEENCITHYGESGVLYSWTPIGVVGGLNPFYGNFNGRDFSVIGRYFNTIEQYNTYNGIFGRLVGSCINLKNTNGYTNAWRYSGGIAGGNWGYIENCYNDATMISGQNGCGGIAGESINLEYTAMLDAGAMVNCVNYGLIVGNMYTAGISGKCGFDGNVGKVKNSKNYGRIYGLVNGNYVGGICGELLSSGCAIIDCENYGNVNISAGFGGGVCGSTVKDTFIINCINYADVSGVSSTGGVVGAMRGVIQYCINKGSVKVLNADEYIFVGGVCGGVFSGGLLEQCYNEGDIYAEDEYVGGVSGGVNGEIKNCYNTGNIYQVGERMYAVGGVTGIVGDTGSYKSFASNCYSIGDIFMLTDCNIGVISGVLYPAINISNTYALRTSNYNVLIGSARTGSTQTGLEFLDSSTKKPTGGTYVGWDFENIWGYVDGVNNNYPVLRCFYPDAVSSL